MANSNHFRLRGPYGLCCFYTTLHCSMKTAIDKMYMKDVAMFQQNVILIKHRRQAGFDPVATDYEPMF